ncbi:methionine adenosyltransferase [Clostridium butyricum]|uniref:methionine adenosyltransferase n=2 Tax=Clostridium butyricum TaxID=1492 RepID=UPI0021062E71|nr:methionine adenosyltransferase [Clostridium butyricum]MCQ2013438.1 methionine adenosyltransferase [Clostridium butyricum]MCQ2027703.1 methionine adenosyltransferase [Clostridium butyricum]MDU4853151.1 methionine adenosyltransferase [Clostridioides difficile]
MNEYFVTCESVTEGHPDKICDQISDAILDRYLEKDQYSRVAIETMVSKNTIMIAGEVKSNGKVDIAEVARDVVRKIGYNDDNLGFNYKTCLIFTNINKQSSDIALGVDKDEENKISHKKILGAGDQGIMYGYAFDETKNYMPITCDLANKLSMRLAYLRKEGGCEWLCPDGKVQVTMKYDESGKSLGLSSIVISAQHKANIDNDFLKNSIMYDVIDNVVDGKWIKYDTKIYINPTGRFVIGGPSGDTGLTGRKIMVDTYGGIGKHGGGAFSGKDPTKVDRSGAYMARYVAKNIVASKLAEKAEVSLSYIIGEAEPDAITINTFGTEKVNKEYLNAIVKNIFHFSVSEIIEELNLRKPQFLKSSVYGHFGRENENFRWEDIDKIQILKEEAIKYICNSFR